MSAHSSCSLRSSTVFDFFFATIATRSDCPQNWFLFDRFAGMRNDFCYFYKFSGLVFDMPEAFGVMKRRKWKHVSLPWCSMSFSTQKVTLKSLVHGKPKAVSACRRPFVIQLVIRVFRTWRFAIATKKSLVALCKLCENQPFGPTNGKVSVNMTRAWQFVLSLEEGAFIVMMNTGLFVE